MLGVPFLDRAISSWFRPHSFDDPVDRLNYFVTSTLLTFFAIMVSAKQYVGSPIQCWMPMEFKGGWEQYAEDYCFIQNTFYIPMEDDIPSDTEVRSKAEIGYYQWVPIFLAIQAIFFYLPNWLWKTLNRHSGIDLCCAVSDARKLRNVPSSERKAEVKKLANYLSECFEMTHDARYHKRFMCFRFGSGLGSYIAMLYLIVKAMYLLNILTQFYALNKFLGSNYHFWGIQTIMDLMAGREWEESGVFPRVTLCDFVVRKLANMHRYTVQCVLMINMFNEKIYLFIWFWFLFVFIVTFINFFYCSAQLVLAGRREAATRQWLQAVAVNGEDIADTAFPRDPMIRRFTHHGLHPDGVLVLRFIEGHAGAIVCRELTHRLYHDYLNSCNALSSKSASPGIDDGHHEQIYNPSKLASLMNTDFATKP